MYMFCPGVMVLNVVMSKEEPHTRHTHPSSVTMLVPLLLLYVNDIWADLSWKKSMQVEFNTLSSTD